MATPQLKVRTAVCGYHVYQDTWSPVLDVEFVCRQDAGNEYDKNGVEITGTEEDEVHRQSQNCCSLHPSDSVNTKMLAESTKSRNNALCGK
jgi:hypothetical protein